MPEERGSFRERPGTEAKKDGRGAAAETPRRLFFACPMPGIFVVFPEPRRGGVTFFAPQAGKQTRVLRLRAAFCCRMGPRRLSFSVPAGVKETHGPDRPGPCACDSFSPWQRRLLAAAAGGIYNSWRVYVIWPGRCRCRPCFAPSHRRRTARNPSACSLLWKRSARQRFPWSTSPRR